jgi:glycosyltransferase involved in cell wall biosynthesis
MVTRGRLVPARFAIECFRRQTWPNRELVIVCGAPDSELPDFLATLGDPAIRYVTAAPDVLGTLRNVSVEEARGTLLCQWDDDDLYHPERLAFQHGQLVAGRAAAHFFSRLLMWWPEQRRLAISSRRMWEGSMLCRRLALGNYPPLARREDTHVVRDLRQAGHRITYTDQPRAYCYVMHGANTSGDRHLTKLFTKATESFGADEYAARLEEFATIFPLHAYEEARHMDT